MPFSLRGLGARFDGVALRPFEPPPPGTADWPALRRWCLDAGRWSVATASAPDAFPRAARLALELDGTDQLDACRGGLQRLALKLRVKWDDLRAGVDLAPGDIWDSGWVPADDAPLAALARFEPRRATLVVIDGLQPAPVRTALAALAARQSAWRRPVRVLLLGAASEAAPEALRLPA